MQSKEIFEKIDNTTYIDRDAEHEMKESFMSYAMAVNVARAIPDVRDGLKPVHRRILYSMNEMGLTADKPFRKCAKIVGDVLGSYHPHGDSSVYDALVRLAQDFTINEPLVDGHGNFGSVDGDDAAAYRYTEARLSKIASELLRDINKDTVDFVPNYDASKVEPRVIPSRFPNLLVNGSDGIAVGMATSIPPHNLAEVINAVIAMIENPNITVDELMEYIPAPDFPTGGEILANNAIKEAYRTGHGGVVMRAITEFESFDDGKRWRIIIKAIPYQVNKARLVKQIADLIKNKKIEGITYVGDQSSGREGMRVVVELKREANPQVVLNQLFKSTQLQLSMGITFLALVNGAPKILNLQEMIFHYLQFQRDVITRRTKYDLNKAEERAHILQGLVVAVNNIDEVIKIIKQSQDKNVALANLQERFELSERQANAILEMKLSRLTGLEVDKLNEELAELELSIEHFKEVLADPKKIDDIVTEELTEIRDKYSNPRKSLIVHDYDDIDLEDLIEKHDVVVSLTNMGYIKSQAVTEYKSQHRGGRGVNSKMKEEDYVTDVFAVNSHDNLMMFSDKGKVYVIKTYMIPEVARQNKGRALVNLLPLESDEKINTILKLETGEDKFLVLATKSGLIKRTKISEFDNVRKNGKIAIKLNEDDALVSAKIVSADDELLMASDNGKCLRFRAKDIRLVGRSSQGVKSMKIDEGESIIDMVVVDPTLDILTVTERGYAKRSKLEDYRLQGRRGKGLKAGVFNEKTGKVVALKTVSEDKDILAISSDGVMIRTHADTINMVSRTSLGVKLMRVGDGDAVVSVAVVDREEDEELPQEIEE